MKILLELELDAQYFEDGNDRVTLEAVRFPGCGQNLMPYMSPVELIKAQAELENAVEQAAISKAEAIRERRELVGDCRREIALEFQREELASRASQRGSRTC
jgi:hypothetical protein